MLLSDIDGWFAEGFDTADLQEAKALLEEMEIVLGSLLARQRFGLAAGAPVPPGPRPFTLGPEGGVRMSDEGGGTGEAPGRELAEAARASEACDGRSAHAGGAPGRPAGVACPPERRRCTPPATRAGPDRRTGRGHIQDQQASLGACGGRGACVTP
jgi:hypothetical protein